ncbi:MAG: hypothetical protein ACPGVP_03755 [Thiolinea sp.]
MKIKSQALLAVVLSSGFMSACSQQQAAPVIPATVVNPPKVVKPVPPPKPYKDLVVKPAPLQPAPRPKPVIRPAPVIKPMPAPVVVVPKPKIIKVPPVKAKGTYRGAVPIDNSLREQYQQ